MIFRWTFLFLAGVSPAFADGSVPLSKYLDCYDAVGAGFYLGKHVPLVPAQRRGEKGFYVFTDKSAYFYPLGRPDSGNNQFNWHYFQLSLPKHADIYFTYSDGKLPGVEPNVSFRPDPAPNMADKYVKISGNDALDDSARSALRAELKRGIGKMALRFRGEQKLRQSESDPKPNLAEYQGKLNKCAFEDDAELRNAVFAEKDKLSGTAAHPPEGVENGDAHGFHSAE